eukprot:482336-Hanusia_phi.AAC.1
MLLVKKDPLPILPVDCQLLCDQKKFRSRRKCTVCSINTRGKHCLVHRIRDLGGCYARSLTRQTAPDLSVLIASPTNYAHVQEDGASMIIPCNHFDCLQAVHRRLLLCKEAES